MCQPLDAQTRTTLKLVVMDTCGLITPTHLFTLTRRICRSIVGLVTNIGITWVRDK